MKNTLSFALLLVLGLICSKAYTQNTKTFKDRRVVVNASLGVPIRTIPLEVEVRIAGYHTLAVKPGVFVLPVIDYAYFTKRCFLEWKYYLPIKSDMPRYKFSGFYVGLLTGIKKLYSANGDEEHGWEKAFTRYYLLYPVMGVKHVTKCGFYINNYFSGGLAYEEGRNTVITPVYQNVPYAKFKFTPIWGFAIGWAL